MARKRTGLRNRRRDGRGTYSIRHKSRTADIYGSMQDGRVGQQDIIAGSAHMPLRSGPAPTDEDLDQKLQTMFHQSRPQ